MEGETREEVAIIWLVSGFSLYSVTFPTIFLVTRIILQPVPSSCIFLPPLAATLQADSRNKPQIVPVAVKSLINHISHS